jgi:hypothetical protein
MITLSQAYNLWAINWKLASTGLAGRSDFPASTAPGYLAWDDAAPQCMGQRNWLPGLFFLALTVGLSGIVFWLALSTSERLYYTGWASLQIGTQRKKNHRATERRYMNDTRTSILHRLLPPEVGAIMVKDIKLIRRDLNNLSQVIGALIMGIVFGVMLLRAGGEPPVGQGDAPTQFMTILRSAMVY